MARRNLARSMPPPGDERNAGAYDRQRSARRRRLSNHAGHRTPTYARYTPAVGMNRHPPAKPFSRHWRQWRSCAVAIIATYPARAAERRINLPAPARAPANKGNRPAKQRHHEAGLAKNDEEQDRIDPGADTIDRGEQHGIDMQNEARNLDDPREHAVRVPHHPSVTTNPVLRMVRTLGGLMPTTPHAFPSPKNNTQTTSRSVDPRRGPEGVRSARRTQALETAPPETYPACRRSHSQCRNARIPGRRTGPSPTRRRDGQKPLAILQDLDGGILWEPVRRAISALLRTPVPEGRAG